MIYPIICLLIAGCILFVMWYIACFPNGEEGEDLDVWLSRKSTNKRSVEDMETMNDLKEENQEKVKDTVDCHSI